jgi:ATP-dependent exoDNAse (exonuclease V) beta subunit
VKDAKAREDALDVTRSFIVQAPAGSGKTELLVQRFIRLLAVCEKPEQVLAITFTRKAAAEMRKRVLERLPNAAEVAHRLRIQTIDAFCTALTRQVPVLARFGAQPEIVEDASDLYDEAAARVFAEYNRATEALLAHLDNNVPLATNLLSSMLRNRDRWLRRTGSAPTRAELEAALASERKRLLDRAKALHPQASEAFARQVLTKEGTWRKRDALAQSLSENEPLRKALHALCGMPPATYGPAQWAALESILALLSPAVAQLEVLFGERGQADFTAFAHGALRALGSVDDPSDLLLSLDQRIAHILVDEFQDTSQSQFTLLEKLTSGWSALDGRTLFLVGDPMQSIYRFREAEVSLFLKARHEGIGAVSLEPLTLTTNRRSQEGLIAWFNDAFARALPAVEDETSGAVPYLAASPFEPKLPGQAVTWHCFYDREEEARRVIQVARGAKGSKAILVRNRAHLDEIVPALKAAGVRWRAIEIEQLGEKQVVQDLYALTRALVHPGDRIAWLAVLRAPWCGLTLADLVQLTEFHRDTLISDLLQDLSRLSPDGQARARRTRDVLLEGLGERSRGTLRGRVEGAWLALGGPACAASPTELEDAEIFLDELEKLEQAGDVDLALLEAKIERLYALPDLDAGADAVEIMTIHRAKGLEFDTVIVPGLDRLPRSGPKPLLVWKALRKGLLLAPIDQTGAGEDATYKYVRELDKEADDLEAGRLFYVAATRARERLHLLACARATEDMRAREPARRSLLAKVWWQAQEHFGEAPAEALQEKPRLPVRDVLTRLPASYSLPRPPPALAWSAVEEESAEKELEFSWATETAKHVGSVVHRWLQRIAEDRMEGWDAKRVDSLSAHFARDLQRRGVPAADVRASADRVADALARTLADPRGRWILQSRTDARSEHRLRVRTGAGMRTCVVDRVFLDDDGTRWVVDFKTSRHEGADIEAFLDLQRERYAAQMQAYAAAVPGSRQGLYFPLLGGWREL